MYDEEEWLALSGVQHFFFCRRRWALIHLEQQWAEDFNTADGTLLHKNAHDGAHREVRGDCVITRALRVHSRTLGLSGICDIVEFHKGAQGIKLKGREGVWQPFPVEYKRGRPGVHTKADELQLCAQALCLEELLCCPVPAGALFYGETRRRHPVAFSAVLRGEVAALAAEMHGLYARGHTPKARPKKVCNACSLRELCLPTLLRGGSAAQYIRKSWEEAP